MIRKFAAILGTLFLCASLAQGRDFYMISVGVSDYPGTENDLRLPSADAKALASVYKKCEQASVLLLTNEKATRQNILSKARSLFSRAGSDDVVVFFFSGHGSKGGFCAYDGLLRFDEIRSLFSACKAKNKIIFADSCHSGDIRQGGSTGHKDLGSDVMLFLSCRSDEYSFETRKMRNGLFSTCLVRCLKGGADLNRDRVITAKELFGEVHKGVVKLSDSRQHPVMWGNFSDNMPVISWK